VVYEIVSGPNAKANCCSIGSGAPPTFRPRRPSARRDAPAAQAFLANIDSHTEKDKAEGKVVRIIDRRQR